MGWGFRYFIFEDDGSLRRLPQQLASELAVGITALPELAGRILKIGEVILETQASKPARVVKVTGTFWRLDERGRAQPDLARGGIEARSTYMAVQRAERAKGPVVDISARLARRKWEERYRWEPTPTEITRMINAIWPKQGGHRVEPLRSIETRWKRRVPVSHEAKNALSECWSRVFDIARQIESLGDESLKGFIAGAREKTADDILVPFIWEGIAQAGERQRQRRKAWKSSKGRWFAVVQRTIWKTAVQSEGSVDLLEFRECDGKGAAVKACRELLKKYADQYDETVTIEVEIHPEIEWRPPDE